MNKDQIRHKCEYCGWLFNFTTNFLEHECFKHFAEDEDRIHVDENYVTIYGKKTVEGPVCQESLDELLIGAVKARRALYDCSLSVFERTHLRKHALWTEVSNTLGGALTVEDSKSRWKYLKDNYLKTRKKVKSYIPSGSAAEDTNALKKPKFKFYDFMSFLNDTFERRQTVNSLPDNIAARTSEQQDNVASSSSFTNISPMTSTTVHASPSMESPICVRSPTPTLYSPRTPTPDNIPSVTPPSANVTTRIPVKNPRKRLQMADDTDLDISTKISQAKKQKDNTLQEALIKALEVPVQIADPLDGFLARLGEGIRRLPYSVRAQLEIQFLTLLAEKEERYSNN